MFWTLRTLFSVLCACLTWGDFYYHAIRKKLRHNCAIQGARLIWKQKIWLSICERLCSLTNQNACFITFFCIQLPLFCTVLRKTALFSANQNRVIFSCILLGAETDLFNFQCTYYDNMMCLWAQENIYPSRRLPERPSHKQYFVSHRPTDLFFRKLPDSLVKEVSTIIYKHTILLH